MGDIDVSGSKWKQVEAGRIVLIQGDSPYAGRLATIVTIISQKKVRRGLQQQE
jgi:large subunit ribosomal protein L14e